MIYAELRREDGGTHGYFTDRYLVYNGDMIGSYGVHYKPIDHALSVPYGASRDYHQPATPEQVEAYEAQQRFWQLDEAEQDAYEAEHGWPCAQNVSMDGCCYLPDGPSICDGSSLVEITQDDRRAFAIAAMMANIEDRDVPAHLKRKPTPVESCQCGGH
jgi:hypothetical protein